MRRSDEPDFADVSNAVTNFSKPVVYTLQSAQINIPKNFMRARFIFPASVVCKIEIN
jgi:hypothetical protein